MILIEFTELPGRVFATHRDRQAGEVAAAYPRDRYAIWNFAGSVRIGRDGAHGRRHARTVGQSQITLRRHGLGRCQRQLARRILTVERQCILIGTRAGRVWRAHFGHGIHFQIGKSG